MARTKASVGAKISSGKSSKARCSVAPSSSSGGSGSGGAGAARSTGGGGNSVCPRETPPWQRPITNFFISKESTRNGDEPSRDSHGDDGNVSTATGAEPRRSKRNVMDSDSEDERPLEPPQNTVLDETIDLEPLNGEDSHKIEEFYPKNGDKGKGKGKKSTNKENEDNNKRQSMKRDLEDTAFGEEPEQDSKRLKIAKDKTLTKEAGEINIL